MNHLCAMSGNDGRSSQGSREVDQRGLGSRIRNVRRRKGWSREQLAQRMGTSQHNLKKWELGAHTPPLTELTKLLEVLGVSFEELVLGHPAPAPALPPGPRNELAMCINRLIETARPLLQPA